MNIGNPRAHVVTIGQLQSMSFLFFLCTSLTYVLYNVCLQKFCGSLGRLWHRLLYELTLKIT